MMYVNLSIPFQNLVMCVLNSYLLFKDSIDDHLTLVRSVPSKL
jgi:hypothetical protein